MLKHFYSRFIPVTLLAMSVWGGNVYADTKNVCESFTSSGEAFSYPVNIDWNKQKLVVTMDISKCNGSNEELFALGNNITDADKQLHVYRSVAGTGGVRLNFLLKHQASDGCSVSGKHDQRYDYNVKENEITFEISKDEGLAINENPIDGLNSHLPFFFNISNLNFGSTNCELQAGTTDVKLSYSKDVEYKSVQVVDIPSASATISNVLASDEVSSTLFENRQCQRDDNDKFSQNVKMDWNNQKLVAKFDVTNCGKRNGNNPDNLLSVGKGISDWDNAVHFHFYYDKTSLGGTSTGATGGTGSSEPKGNLICYFFNNSKNRILDKTITITGNEINIEISKENGLVINNESVNGTNTNFASAYADLWALEDVELGSLQGGGRSDALINYVNIVNKAGNSVSSNILRQGYTNTFISQNHVNVQIDRTFVNDGWYTLCLPFDVEESDVKAVFGNAVQLRTFKNMEGTTMNFSAETSIEAGKPYLIKVDQTISNPSFTNVNLVAPSTSDGNPEAVGDKSLGYFMQGIYGVTELACDGTNLFLGDKDKFYKPSDEKGANIMNGLRAYFIVPSGTDTSALYANINGTVLAVDQIKDVEIVENQPVYNLNGVRMSGDIDSLPRGIYIRGGKKFVVK